MIKTLLNDWKCMSDLLLSQSHRASLLFRWTAIWLGEHVQWKMHHLYAMTYDVKTNYSRLSSNDSHNIIVEIGMRPQCWLCYVLLYNYIGSVVLAMQKLHCLVNTFAGHARHTVWTCRQWTEHIQETFLKWPNGHLIMAVIKFKKN